VSLVNHAEGMNVKRIERFTKQLIPVDVIEGFEPKKTAAPSRARPGWRPGEGRAGKPAGAKPGQRTFAKPGAPRKDGGSSFSRDGGGYRGQRTEGRRDGNRG
jgi:hypothetical protein